MIYVAIASDITSTVQAHRAYVIVESRITNITSYTSRDLHNSVLDLVSRTTNVNIMRQSSKELCNLLLYGDSNSNIMIDRVILEATLKYIKNSRRFEKTQRVSTKISTFPITTRSI